MDFKFTEEQESTRKEMLDVCRELDKQKPVGFIGLESSWRSEEGWEFNLYCAKEFAKRV